MFNDDSKEALYHRLSYQTTEIAYL